VVDTVTRRPGGRSARIRSAVLASTLELLVRDGFDSLSLDAVAEHAGVHRTTLYRRWGSPTMLVVDALIDRSDTLVAVPDEGTLRADLQTLMAAVRANLESPLGEAVTVALAGARTDELVQAARRFWDDRLERMSVVVSRAVDRSEIAPADPHAVIELVIAPLFFRVLVDRRPIDDALVDMVTRTMVDGLAAR
jgi:AcrR family transcriptional regulator